MEFLKLIALLLQVSWVLSSTPNSNPGTVVASADIAQETKLSIIDPRSRKSRQSRCVRCYDDPYDYERRQYSGNSRSYDDRGSSNWYYTPERQDRYDDRQRYGSERDRYYYSNNYDRESPRYEDRYSSRSYDRYDRDRYDTSRSNYDRYDTRSGADSRNYGGYDSRKSYDRYTDRYFDGYNRDRFYERPRYNERERESYDRYPARYDYRTYRPYDETYRGQSGFDSSGRGYYFANGNDDHYQQQHKYRPPQTPSTAGPPYLPNNENARPYQNSNAPQSSSGQSASSSTTSEISPPRGPSSNNFDYDKTRNDQDSGKYAGQWNYVSEADRERVRDRDTQSSSYGSRSRPLSGSYLHERDTPIPEAMTSEDKTNDSTKDVTSAQDDRRLTESSDNKQ